LGLLLEGVEGGVLGELWLLLDSILRTAKNATNLLIELANVVVGALLGLDDSRVSLDLLGRRHLLQKKRNKDTDAGRVQWVLKVGTYGVDGGCFKVVCGCGGEKEACVTRVSYAVTNSARPIPDAPRLCTHHNMDDYDSIQVRSLFVLHVSF